MPCCCLMRTWFLISVISQVKTCFSWSFLVGFWGFGGFFGVCIHFHACSITAEALKVTLVKAEVVACCYE